MLVEEVVVMVVGLLLVLLVQIGRVLDPEPAQGNILR
jgi:hypothetical protein